jgi:hypothetical protein
MLVTANLAELSMTDNSDWIRSLQTVSLSLTVVGAAGALWVLGVTATSLAGMTYTSRYVLGLAISVLLFSAGLQTCYADVAHPWDIVRFVAIWAGPDRAQPSPLPAPRRDCPIPGSL